MHLPARNHRVIAKQHLMHHYGMQADHQRQADHKESAHDCQPARLV